MIDRPIPPQPNPDETESNGIVIIWAIIIFAILFSSCSNLNEESNINEMNAAQTGLQKEFKINEYTVVSSYVIDSCEYVGYIGSTVSKVNYLTHKGNCRFCAKRDTIK